MALQGLRSAFNRSGSDPDPRTAAVLTPAASSITGGAVIGCPSCGRAMRKGSKMQRHINSGRSKYRLPG